MCGNPDHTFLKLKQSQLVAFTPLNPIPCFPMLRLVDSQLLSEDTEIPKNFITQNRKQLITLKSFPNVLTITNTRTIPNTLMNRKFNIILLLMILLILSCSTSKKREIHSICFRRDLPYQNYQHLFKISHGWCNKEIF